MTGLFRIAKYSDNCTAAPFQGRLRAALQKITSLYSILNSSLLRSARKNLPEPLLARWASLFFSASVLTILISLAASQVLLAFASVAYSLHLLRNQLTRRDRFEACLCRFPPIKLPLALFSLFTVISVFGAANSTPGWLAVRKLVLFLIWLLAVNLIVSAKQLQVLFQVLFVESAVAGLVAAGQFVAQYRSVRALHPGQVYLYMTSDRIRGFMGHWMSFGGQQMLVFCALLAALLLARGAAPGGSGVGDSEFEVRGSLSRYRPSNAIGWLTWAVVAISILLNFTRGVWLGCIGATVYLVLRWKPRWLLAAPALLLVGYLAAPPLVRQRLKALRHPATEASVSIRFEMWQVALRMIRKHPYLGIGPNNVEQEYVLYLPRAQPPELGYHEHLHNVFLQLGAERGLPCLAAWIWLMAALCWNFVRIRRRLIREHRPAWVADGAIAAWLAFVAEGCFEFNFGTSSVLMLFLFVTSTPFLVEEPSRVEG